MIICDAYCRFCGKPMMIEASGVTHHLLNPKPPGRLDDTDYDEDADHVAVAEQE